MKIEELREIASNYKRWVNMPCPACSMEIPTDGVPCYCMDALDALRDLQEMAISHIDALLDLWEAAQEVIRTCGGLPGTEVLHEMEKALEKLEAIK